MWQILLAAVLGAAVPAGAAATPAAVDDIVRQLQARYDDTPNFTAAVTQEMEIASLGRTLTAHGTVFFRRPGRMRWEMTGRDRQVIVADGQTLWVYQPEEKQAYKASFAQAFRSTTPVSFLTGIGRITEDFTVSLEGETGDLFRLRLVPRSGGDIGSLRLGVDRATYDIREAEVRDPLGNVTRLRFSDLQRNQELRDDLFRFDIPRGTEVIEAPQPME